MTVNEGGTWRLAGEQYFSAGDLTLNGGTVILNNGRDIRMNGGTMTVSATAGGSSFTTESSGAITLYSSPTFDVADGTAAHDLTVAIPINQSGTHSLTKTGEGTMRLTANANHSGSTAVAAGTLSLGAGAALVNSSLIRIDAGATLDVSDHGGAYAFTVAQTLAGPGTVAGGVSLEGTITPGASPETLSFTSDLILANTTILEFELNPADTTVGGGINDLLAIGGSLTLDGLLNLTATSGDFASAALGDTWTLATYAGTLTDNGLDLGTLPGLAGGLSWQVDTSTGGLVNLTVIPEPRLALLGSMGLLFLLRRRRSA